MWGLIRNCSKVFRVTSLASRVAPFCSTSPNIEELTNGDKELEHKLKVLILEVDVMRQEGRMVPDAHFFKDKHWKDLLDLPSFSGRRRYLEYLFKLSKAQENRKVKKEEKLKERGEKPAKIENQSLEDFAHNYELGHNNILLRVYDTTVNNLYNNKLIQAMQFGQKLVIDCGFDRLMNKFENVSCAKQLTLLFAENRIHDDPFDLHFCNVDHDSISMSKLSKHIGTLHEPWFPLHLHTSSYLDKFPKKNLVYLTPHCREELVYSHDDIYIIGAIVDKFTQEPLSLAKAKREGLRMAKLPLDRYLQWGSGSGKNLTLNQVTSILLDVKSTGDWQYSLRHVPRRKIVDIQTEMPTQSQQKHWSPSNKIDFNTLSYKGRSRDRGISVKSLMEE